LAAVGELQLDVVTARLNSEYGVASVVERLPFVTACRVGAGADGADALVWPTRDALRTEDRCGRLAALFASDWARKYAEEKHPQATFRAVA
jgi:peptide chain release factor 3